jgi:hypothetical protein
MQSNGDLSLAPASEVERRAYALWPRLDRKAIRRCAGDTRCIVAVVSRRTALPTEAIRLLLLMPSVTRDEGSTWFG